ADATATTVTSGAQMTTNGTWYSNDLGDVLTSAGDYLYNSSGTNGNTYSQPQIRRITKATGAIGAVAGTTTSGYWDGTGADAFFGQVITGIATDGTRLWVADTNNNRFRKVVATQSLPAGQPAASTT